MALNYVSLTVDTYDGQGSYPSTGTATFTPSAVLTDTTNHEIVTQVAVTVAFYAGRLPVAKLLATDNPTLTPSGWAWSVSFSDSSMPASWTFFLPFSGGAAQNLSSLAAVPAGSTSLLTEAAQQLLAEG